MSDLRFNPYLSDLQFNNPYLQFNPDLFDLQFDPDLFDLQFDPDLFDLQFNPDLSGEVAVVIGHGNVALDVARILLKPTEQLEVRSPLPPSCMYHTTHACLTEHGHL